MKRESSRPHAGWWLRLRTRGQLRRALRVQPRKGVVVATSHDEGLARVKAAHLVDSGIRAFVWVQPAAEYEHPKTVYVIVRPEDEAEACRLLDHSTNTDE